ncbi:hypothetical protein C4097_15400 [Clostridioides difficile]|nr:hypothetical protein [Clostridioides difficile]
MIIDIVFAGYEEMCILENNIIYIINELINRGYKIRVFVAYELQYEKLKNDVKNLYFYGLNKYLNEGDETNLAFEYRKIIEDIGVPDIILSSNTSNSVLVCKLAVIDLEDEAPSIISCIYEEPSKDEVSKFMKHADAHFSISDKIAKNIYLYSEGKAIIYSIENFVRNSNVDLDSIVNKFEALFLKYLEKQSTVFESIEYLIEHNDFENALNLVSKYNVRFGNNLQFINMKSVLAMNMNEYQVAINNLEYSELVLKEVNLDLYYNLAYAYYKISDWSKSLEKYKYIYNIVDESEKQEVISLINDVYEGRDNDFRAFCREENLFCDNSYNKTILYDTFYKKFDNSPKDIYISRQNVNKLTEDKNPEVSILVLAYNKLEEYTRKCVESILKYTIDIDYELILFDNGSSDGTYDYFKSIKHDKKKIIKVTKNFGASYSNSLAFKEMDGKYLVCISNDAIVTKNWLSNMLKCAKSDNKIGIIHPGCDHAPLEHKIDFKYKSLEDMQKKAEEYNISDPRKWYEVFNLYTVVTLFTRECIDVIGIPDYGYVHHAGDVDIILRARRSGYKSIICKDTFVAHIGNSMDKGENLEVIGSLKGTEFFEKKHHLTLVDIDSCDVNLIQLIESETIIKERYDVLGIDVKCGPTILEMKNRIREKGAYSINLYGFSQNAKYWLDLKAICEDVYVDHVDYINKYYRNKKFDYIAIGNYINSYDHPYDFLEDVMNLLSQDGCILLKLKNNYDVNNFLHMTNNYVDFTKQDFKVMDINLLNSRIEGYGFYIDSIVYVEGNIDTSIRKKIDYTFDNVNLLKNMGKSIYIDEYNLKLKRLGRKK